MEKIPTAEEILSKHLESMVKRTEQSYCSVDEMKAQPEWDASRQAMIELAKLHVKAALKQAAHNSECYNKAKFKGDQNWVVDIELILNSYPLENIK